MRSVEKIPIDEVVPAEATQEDTGRLHEGSLHGIFSICVSENPEGSADSRMFRHSCYSPRGMVRTGMDVADVENVGSLVPIWSET